MRRGLSAAQWTVLLSCTLVVGAAGLGLSSSTPRILDLGVPQVVIVPFLMAMFLVAELFLMNVEFRRQAYSLTMAGVPLLIGVLVLPSHTLVIVRLVGTASSRSRSSTTSARMPSRRRPTPTWSGPSSVRASTPTSGRSRSRPG
jgi:hypothetical protein